MPSAPATVASTSPPDPHPDRTAATITTSPTRSGGLLSLVRRLIDHGRNFVAALRQAATDDPAEPSRHELRMRFGRLDLAAIIARITRGLQLAAALEYRLLDNGARLDREPPVADAPPQREPRPDAPRGALPPARPARDADALAAMPTPEEIAAQVRRRPIGAVIADICLDLGILPSDPLWQDLQMAVIMNGGDTIALTDQIFKRICSGLSVRPDDAPEQPAPECGPPPRRVAEVASTGPP